MRAYLQNPTKAGIWRLRAPWLADAGISKAIWDQLTPRIAAKDEIAIQAGKRQVVLKLGELNERETKDRITRKISFILELFRYLRSLDEPSGDLTEVSHVKSSVIFEAVDLNAIRAAYSEAYDYFRTEVDSPDLDTAVQRHQLSRNKGGTFLLSAGPKDGDLVSCFALSPEPLERVGRLLTLVGKIGRLDIRPIFSPEEEVFEPYFPFVQLSQESIAADSRLQPQFNRAFSEYAGERYEGCISALGVIAEDYLTQVYETLLRDVAPRGRTLGQLYDALHTEINALFKKDPPQPADLDALYQRIAVVIKPSPGSPEPDGRQALEIVRDVVSAIRSERTLTHHLLRQLKSDDSQLSVFPRTIRSNLNELIRYRNAAAHKTRVPLGNYEALRTLFALVTFVMWWQESLEVVDWRADRIAIIEEFIKRAS